MTKKIIIAIGFIGLLLPVSAQKYNQSSITPDSATAAASEKFKKASVFKWFFIGNNYRKEWSAGVKMQIFRLPGSGLNIIELGGGQQTKSLKLKDQRGKEWALRTVDKDAAGAIPKGLQGTIVQQVVQEIISGSYPYAPLVVGYLAQSAGIIAPNPKLYYIPADAGLGNYQDVFTGKVCFLEEKEPTRKGSVQTESTSEVQEEIIEANDQLVMQREVLKARLLDMLIADWDRHADQWRWGVVDSTKAKYYYAIPRDRDQAFFMAKGLIPKIGKLVAMHHINWFKNETKGIKKLSYKSWKFDQLFLTDLDAAEWQRVIKEFKVQLTDKIIAEAVKKLPPEIYAISGQEIENILINRRNSFEKPVMKYYEFISHIVEVNGSNEDEVFRVSGGDDYIKIAVYKQQGKQKKDIKIYDRKFKSAETSIINLMGLKGNDKFIIDDSVHSKIKIHMYGGEGKDEYNIQGRIKSVIHDNKSEDEIVNRTPLTKIALK